jgi:manganese oxidase
MLSLVFRLAMAAQLGASPLVVVRDAVKPAPPERAAINDNRTPAGELNGGVLTLQLEARPAQWFPEADNGKSVLTWGFAEPGRQPQMPGPLIRVPAGTLVRLTLRNLVDSTLVIYGLHTRPGTDDDTVQVAPGGARHVSFRLDAPGTYFYWATFPGRTIEDRLTLDAGLSGALIVDPRGTAKPRDRVLVISDWFQPPVGDRGPLEAMAINGKGWPHTERFEFVEGDSVHWRVINVTSVAHPMHLHGFYFRPTDLGSWFQNTSYAAGAQWLANTHLLLPGQTMAIAWQPTQPGNWVFHCHFAFHVSPNVSLDPTAEAPIHADHSGGGPPTGGATPHAMFGLVLGIHVRPAPNARHAASTAPVRRIRLLVQSAPKRTVIESTGHAYTTTSLGYVVQEGDKSPPRDSINIPGPLLVLRRGEPVQIAIVNNLDEPTGVHWHGLEIESFPDGVPGWSGTPGRIFPPIAPRDSFVAEFTPPRAGTFIYHAHAHERIQINSGLYGALLVADAPRDTTTDRLFIVGSGGPPPDTTLDSPFALVNGSATPPPLELRVGKTYRLRLINIHPDWRVIFALLSDTAYAQWRPVAKDGADLAPGLRRLRPAHLLTGPGETADFEFTPSTPGDLRLEIKTMVPGWTIPVQVHVKSGSVRHPAVSRDR